MKTAGIQRKIDGLGRIVIPMEIRNKFEIKQNEPLDIHVEGNSIVLRKNTEDCTFCGSTKGIVEYKGKNICSNCLKEIKGIK